MEANKAREWLRIQVETKVQLSGKPAKIAVWGVVLELPADVAETIMECGAIYGFGGHFWFDYETEKITVCVPIKIKE